MSQVTGRHYPQLSEIVSIEHMPSFLSFVQNGLNDVFGKLHYKNLQVSKSPHGDTAFYSLDIVSANPIELPLPFGLALELNPDTSGGGASISSFPITLQYQWEILAYLKSFNLDGFAFTPEAFFHLGLQVFRLSEAQVLAHAFNFFVQPAAGKTIFEQLENDINGYLTASGSSTTFSPPTDQTVSAYVDAIKSNTNLGSTPNLIFSLYIANSDLDKTKDNLQSFYDIMVPDGIEAFVKKLIVPRAKASLSITTAISFPPSILKPIKADGSEYDDKPPVKTRFLFAQADLYVDTEAGISYQLELGGSLMPNYATIGNTGLILQIESLKLDLSRKENIPEADADGRPIDFVGVYARAISITLPPKWFKDDTAAGSAKSKTLRLAGYDLLVGTGGLSGTIALETIALDSGTNAYYFEDKFDLTFPVKVWSLNLTTGKGESKSIANITELKESLFPASPATHHCSLQFPITLTEKVSGNVSGNVYIFSNALDYQQYLNTQSDEKMLWKTIGSSTNGFRVGFSAFDIRFEQNKVVSSNIKGALLIKKFTYPAGSPNAGKPVQIDIEGHLHDNGDFNLTASANPPYPIELPNVFTYHLRSVELGKDGGDYYLGTSGDLEFLGDVKNLLKLDAIHISRLRIYSNGSIELEGGSINLLSPKVLRLGPVDLTVTALHFGSHQREHNGQLRKYNYFGFDGGIKVDPLGVEVRGDGVKFYYTVDNSDTLSHHAYLHIQTLYIDLVIPAKNPTAVINGWISIPEPGVSPEYAGGIKLEVPKAKITGGADIRLMPKYPAFIIDASINLPKPIPLGSFAIYGFRGLLGYRYVAEKEAIGLVSGVNTWYDYYKAPARGINVMKFSGPDKTARSGTPISIGAGVSLGTSADNGTVANIKAMALLSIPSLFMVDGKISILAKRTGLDDSSDPPISVMLAIGDNSLEFAFNFNYRIPKSSGLMLDMNAGLEAAYFFNNPSAWYINMGTKAAPNKARVLSLFTLRSYVMLSASGIEAGARGELQMSRSFLIVKLEMLAYLELGGKISFEKPQISAYLLAGVMLKVSIKFIRLSMQASLLLAAEAPKPFRIAGKFHFEVEVVLFRLVFRFFRRRWEIKVSFRFSGDISFVWEFDRTIDKNPINPLINKDAANGGAGMTPGAMAKGVNMLTNESFELAYFDDRTPPTPDTAGFDALFKQHVLPLDTYIDLKTEKGLVVSSLVADKIGGLNNPPDRYVDLIGPDSSVMGVGIRQVRHQYSIESIEIQSWDATTRIWKPYHPYVAFFGDDPSMTAERTAAAGLKIGQFQKSDNQYNAIRLLATTPFSYTEQGQPGWFIPEQYGINSASLFCQATIRKDQTADFQKHQLGQQYTCFDENHKFYSNNVAFLLFDKSPSDYAVVTDRSNPHPPFSQSIGFGNYNQLRILLPQPSLRIGLLLSSNASAVKIKYYAAFMKPGTSTLSYGHPDPAAPDMNQPFETTVVPADWAAKSPIQYNDLEDKDAWRPVSMIEIQPLYAAQAQGYISYLQQLISNIEYQNLLITLGQSTGIVRSTTELQNALAEFKCSGGSIQTKTYRYFPFRNENCEVQNGVPQRGRNPSWNYTTNSRWSTSPIGFRLAAFDNNGTLSGPFSPTMPASLLFVEGDHLLLDLKMTNGYNGPYTASAASVVYNGSKALVSSIFIRNYIFKFLNSRGRRKEILQSIGFDFEVTYFEKGNHCGQKIDDLCNLYATLNNIFTNNFIAIEYYTVAYQSIISKALEETIYLINQFAGVPQHQQYNLSNIAIVKKLRDFDYHKEYDYPEAYEAYQTVLEYLKNVGRCECKCEDDAGQTLLQQVSWLSVEDYVYNKNIPDQNAIQSDSQATIEGIAKYVQPIWRPNTDYILKVVMKDIVGDNPYNGAHNTFNYVFGFRTAGPIGHFHTAPGNTYGQQDILTAPDKYPLSNLRGYIDYDRSYPNANGNLLGAKPMFYGDVNKYDKDGTTINLVSGIATTQVNLFFSNSYALHFFNDWPAYNGSPLIVGELKILLKDPVEDVALDNPPVQGSQTGVVPESTTAWEPDKDPQISTALSLYGNLFNSNNCVKSGEVIKPMSKYVVAIPNYLKPSKIYTAVISNVFYEGSNKKSGLDVHKFVFQTSRYKTFQEQVESYKLKGNINGQSTGTEAVFNIDYPDPKVSDKKIADCFQTLTGPNLPADPYLDSFQHRFDRIVEGILALSPLPPAASTEFNVLRQTKNDVAKPYALLVRNPEPFNLPKMPLADLEDTLQVLGGNGLPDNSFHVLLSKDGSQALIMKDNGGAIPGKINLLFRYKVWDGSSYQTAREVKIKDLELEKN